MDVQYSQAPSSKSESEEEKTIWLEMVKAFLGTEICFEFKAVFCTALDYSWLQSKLSKTLLHLRVLCW